MDDCLKQSIPLILTINIKDYILMQKAFHSSRYLYLFLTLIFSNTLFAGTNHLEHRQGLLDIVPDLGKNSRWAIDFSTRFNRDLTHHDGSSQYVVGFDFHKIFSGKNGDIGTLTFQPYWVQLSNVNTPPFFFDNGDDGELTWRIANFNYTALSNGGFNIRLGHFEVPFGLEQNIDTNGTTRQYTFSDRAIKADWGISINGVLPTLDYEVAITQGSGNDITNKHNPFLFSGRISTPSTANIVTGISWFHGDILNGEDTVRRDRIGFDLAYYYYQWEALLEVSGGEDDKNSKANALLELSWRTPREDLHSYMQYRQSRQEMISGWHNGNSLALGVNWNVNAKIIVSGEWLKELDTLFDKEPASQFVMQFRVRI
jgi:hypothetical protein